MQVKISIIVPVYNTEKYVRKCLDSLLGQTLKEIEIICVDDASPDACGEILDHYAREDSRIRAVHLDRNQGTLAARIRGMDQVSGCYVMFVDSDDYLEPAACEELYRLMQETQADLVHFGTRLHAGANVSARMMQWVEDFLLPHEGELADCNLAECCFCRDQFDFNITDKIWKREICSQAFASVQKTRLVASEDRYLFFLLIYYARRYYGVRKKYYHYNLGIGITGGDGLTLEQFAGRCGGALAGKLVEDFLAGVPDGKRFQEAARCFRDKILRDCVDCWHNKLSREDSPEGFRILRRYFEPDRLAGALARAYFEDKEDILLRIRFKNAGRIGIFYRYLGYENMDRKILAYIGFLREAGYEVFLYTDRDRQELVSGRDPEGIETEYLPGIETEYLPDSYGANWDRYEERAAFFLERLQKDGIRILLYASPTSHIAWLDRLLAELANVTVIELPDEIYLDEFGKRIREAEEAAEKARKEKEEILKHLEGKGLRARLLRLLWNWRS